MTPGWKVPAAMSTAHYFAADGHSLCGRLVNPRISSATPGRTCQACLNILAAGPECHKHRYPSRVEALLVLAEVKKKDSTRRVKIEQRAYYHDPCRSWHLTSRGDS